MPIKNFIQLLFNSAILMYLFIPSANAIDFALIDSPTINYDTTIERSICNGDTLQLSNYSFATSGKYNILLQATDGTDSMIDLTLIVFRPIITAISKTICEGDSLFFVDKYIKTPGIYEGKLSNINGCDSTVTLTLEVERIIFRLGTELEIVQGERIKIQPAITGPISYIVWQSNEILNCDTCMRNELSPHLSTTIYAVGFSANGCSSADSLYIHVIVPQNIYLPGAFSPNNDGINDMFYPFTNANIRNIVNFKIYNRWGNTVFERQNFKPNEQIFGWDGTVDEKIANEGYYSYFIKAEAINDEQEELTGELFLLR